jgi:uncharacterized SAM-binding protein YcdF (DUF218 family)
VVFALLIVITQLICFLIILTKFPGNHPADLIAVFRGSTGRIIKGHDLANKGLAQYLTISPSSEKQLKKFRRIYGKKNRYQYLVENRAETTFQNAKLVTEIANQNQIKSILLVTSDYHMPRSYFLLKLQMLGGNVMISPHSVEAGRFGMNPLDWSTVQKKQIHNEMIEFWGSIAEMIHYSLSGTLPEKGLKQNKAISGLRSILLFDLNEK